MIMTTEGEPILLKNDDDDSVADGVQQAREGISQDGISLFRTPHPKSA
jgi:hypothetical protein